MSCSIDVVARIFDIWAFEGDEFLLRCTIALIVHLEPKLYVGKHEALETLKTSSIPCSEYDFIELLKTVYF